MGTVVIYRGDPIPYAPSDTDTPLSIQQRLEYLAAMLLLDEAVLRFGPERKAAA